MRFILKGPYQRVKFDHRRTWECPVCRHRERAGGEIVSRLCRCQKAETKSRQFMKLVHEPPRGFRLTSAAIVVSAVPAASIPAAEVPAPIVLDTVAEVTPPKTDEP